MSASWERMEYLTKGGRAYDGGEGGIGHQISHSLHEIQHQKLLLRVHILNAKGDVLRDELAQSPAMNRQYYCNACALRLHELQAAVWTSSRRLDNHLQVNIKS
ncbi:hypothetical protein EVAR_12093_1 [Eumeta japonica]|uniref:Uncharacterized protein n=1 Tax=Eumeta variegata TaxID=151549 RepID=A0A4C1U563_EUMVA|nr:hypothetical protein EVAR_12093_1 [Eumeta japonica]